MSKYSLEATYLIVRDHLLAQNKVARNPVLQCCAYRGANGTKCAVGVLIADEFYDPDLENVLAYDDRILDVLGQSGYPSDEKAALLYAELQRVHDNRLPELWKDELPATLEEFMITHPRTTPGEVSYE